MRGTIHYFHTAGRAGNKTPYATLLNACHANSAGSLGFNRNGMPKDLITKLSVQVESSCVNREHFQSMKISKFAIMSHAKKVKKVKFSPEDP